jgi:nucleotide-binding universal stress UspA family protein
MFNKAGAYRFYHQMECFMKILIISDIKGKSDTILPFGLKLARHLQAEVEVFHAVDPRINHGVPTPYADSHTISPAEKLSFEEVIHKEKGEAQEELDQLLSRETSRQNYPLKVALHVEATSIANKLLDPDMPSDCLLLINKEPDGQIFISRQEIIDICRKFRGICLTVPPGQEAAEFKNILLPTDFTNKDKKAYEKISSFIRSFSPFINAVNTGSRNIQTGEWKSLATEIFPGSQMNCHTLDADGQDALVEYAGKIQPDLIVWPNQPQPALKAIFKKDMAGTLLEKTSSAVLFCGA